MTPGKLGRRPMLVVVAVALVAVLNPAFAATPHRIEGTAGRDVLRGTEGDDVVLGFGGADRINPRGGDDVVDAGSGNDVITLVSMRRLDRSGRDRARAGLGNDLVYAGSHDRVTLGPGRDTGDAGGAGSVLHGGPGADVLEATDSGARVYGDHGDDILCGPDVNALEPHPSGPHRYFLGFGDDKAFWGWSCYEEHDSIGPDVVFGGPGDDRILLRNAGRDRTYGGSGNDLIRVKFNRQVVVVDCGPGRDVLELWVDTAPEIRRCESVIRR